MSNKKRTVRAELEVSVNQSTLEKAKKLLNSLSVNAGYKERTKGISKELKDAGVAASKLAEILDKSWNAKIGQLDLSNVRGEIQKTWGSAQKLQKLLAESGEEGAYAYNTFASSVLRTNLHLKQSNKLLDDFAESFGNTVKWGISSSIFNNLTSSLEKAINFTMELDSSLNDIRIVTNKSADEMERFAQNANKAAKNLGSSTRDYTDAALIYYQQGDDDAIAQAKAETTLKTANENNDNTIIVTTINNLIILLFFFIINIFADNCQGVCCGCNTCSVKTKVVVFCTVVNAAINHDVHKWRWYKP